MQSERLYCFFLFRYLLVIDYESSFFKLPLFIYDER